VKKKFVVLNRPHKESFSMQPMEKTFRTVICGFSWWSVKPQNIEIAQTIVLLYSVDLMKFNGTEAGS